MNGNALTAIVTHAAAALNADNNGRDDIVRAALDVLRANVNHLLQLRTGR